MALRTNKEMLGVLLLGAPSEGAFTRRPETPVARLREPFRAHAGECAPDGAAWWSRKRLQRDLALAAEVQKRLLPRHSLETPVAALAGLNLPARSVGGDYYDFLDLRGDRTASRWPTSRAKAWRPR